MDRFNERLQFPSRLATKIYRQIAAIDAVKGQWRLVNTLSPQMVQRLQSSVLVTSTGASTRIEGSKLSDKQVQALFRKHRITKFRTRDEQEVGGYLEVLQTVFEHWNSIPFSESSILHLHQQMLQHSQKDARHKGTYKFGSNRVEARDETGQLVGIIFDPTPPHLVSKEMQELVAWTKQELEDDNFPTLLIIANFIFEFLAIHPFQDGNGRMSRILTNLLLLQSGYEFCPFVSHEKIIEDNKADYYIALNQTQQSWKSDNEDVSSWVLFFLKVLETQSQQALKLMIDEPTELFLSDLQNQVWEYANSVDTFSRKEVVEATGVNIRTVDYTLRKLIEMNKIERFGQGRATRYRIKITDHYPSYF
jgi:Fic family protein